MTDSAGAAGDIPSSASVWYALQVKPHNEHRVHDHLTSKSIRAFLPLIEAVYSGGSHRRAVLKPLFPCYLFVSLDRLEGDPRGWHAVRWTPGVRAILGTGETPVPVPREAVQVIQERVKDHGFVRLGVRFQAGARVRFRNGLLAGLEALFERPMSRSGRVRVLMNLLGRQTRLEIDPLDLQDA